MTSNSASKDTIIIRRVVIIALIIACLGARFIYLEADPPAWGISFYQPADEGPYAYLAINEKTYGSFNPSTEVTGGHATWVSENFIMNIVGNLMNVAGFKIFGNNYYGLRVPYVIIFFINFLLMFILLNQLRKRYRPDDGTMIDVVLVLMLWIAIDFSFFLSSRYVEPSAVRMMLTLLIAIVYVSMPESGKLRYFIVGALITFSCFMVYITNVFLYLAMGLVILYIAHSKGRKDFMNALVWFIAGCAVCFVLVEMYYILYWHTEAIKNALEAVSSFSEDSMATGDSKGKSSLVKMIGGLAVSFFRVFSANSFAYNLPLLFAMIVTLPSLLKVINRRKDSELLFLTVTPIAFFLQSFIAYDTVTRKMVIVFPLVICSLFVFYLVNKSSSEEEKKSLRASNLWIALTFLFVTVVFLYRFLLFDQSCDDYNLIGIAIVFVLEYLPVMAFTGLYIYFKNMNKFSESIITDEEASARLSRIRVRWIGAFLALMCVCNLMYDYYYLWRMPHFGEKKAMIEMADYVDGQYVLGGGFQLGYTLYNNMLPIVTSPKETMKQADLDEGTMIFEYSNEKGEMDNHFDKTYFRKSKKRFKPDYLVKRKYRAFGKIHNMCINRVCTPAEYARFLRDREENDDVEYPSLTKNAKGEDIDMIVCTDFYGDIHGDIDYDIYGNVYGNIYGNVNATIHGTVMGDIFGEVNGTITEYEDY